MEPGSVTPAKVFPLAGAERREVGEGVEGEGIFLSSNFSVVEAHVGGDASLHCWVNRGSDFGTVRTDKA